MKDYQVSSQNFDQFFNDIGKELEEHGTLIVNCQSAKTGKWGMSRLWRAWMSTTAKFMAAQGCTMPLMIKGDGGHFGKREFNANDAHELFTAQWLSVDAKGIRLSWAKQGHDDMRPATKGERYTAMMKHENWCVEKGIKLFKPRGSEYSQLEEGENI